MGNAKVRTTLGRGGHHNLVLVPRSRYRRLLRRLEDLEDALALDRAENTSKSLLDYAEVRERLKRAGRL